MRFFLVVVKAFNLAPLYAIVGALLLAELAVAVYALVKLFGKEDDGAKEDASHEV